MLFALSARPWPAVAALVLDYYEREILGKFIVARHIRFSSVYRASWAPSTAGETPSPAPAPR